MYETALHVKSDIPQLKCPKEIINRLYEQNIPAYDEQEKNNPKRSLL